MKRLSTEMFAAKLVLASALIIWAMSLFALLRKYLFESKSVMILSLYSIGDSFVIG